MSEEKYSTKKDSINTMVKIIMNRPGQVDPRRNGIIGINFINKIEFEAESPKEFHSVMATIIKQIKVELYKLSHYNYSMYLKIDDKDNPTCFTGYNIVIGKTSYVDVNSMEELEDLVTDHVTVDILGMTPDNITEILKNQPGHFDLSNKYYAGWVFETAVTIEKVSTDVFHQQLKLISKSLNTAMANDNYKHVSVCINDKNKPTLFTGIRYAYHI